ncbi:MAG: aminotransferase class I/II-fold pyridoxal phosphate-dependent enzyme, partial [Candidatus Neomarinimicrobiota bacterium]
MFDLERLVRPNIRRLQPYRSARSEFSGQARIWLDANENPYDNGLNRYPDPLQRELKLALAGIKNLPPESIFLGNGSDEAIDLLIRAFCEPGRDKILIMPPTYDMYAVSAAINNVAVVQVPLDRDFGIDRQKLLPFLEDPLLKLVFICSPNNPTGNLPDRREILEIAMKFNGLVVLDEAYQDFATADSLAMELERHPNLVVLQTFSKARALAGARLGMAFAQPAVIDLLNRIKPPYNINQLTQKAALDCL